MDKEMVIQNIVNNYGKYGITREDIEFIINDSEKEGLSYDFIYFNLQLALTDYLELDFFECTARQMASAFGTSDDKILKIIKEKSKELNAKADELDDYYFKVPVEIGEKLLNIKEQ